MIDWRNANAQGKLACVVWQKKGGPDKDALVFMRLEEFQELLGDTKRDPVFARLTREDTAHLGPLTVEPGHGLTVRIDRKDIVL